MSKAKRLAELAKVRRVVVKVGSGVLASDDGSSLCQKTLARLVADVSALEGSRFELLLVSSGAVMAGARKLGLDQANMSIPQKQASAAVGQVQLLSMYDKEFSKHGRQISQILLTHDDIANRRRFLNARNAISALLELGIMPIINENDSAAVHEIKFGDNDTLAAMITAVVEADLLLILSDVDGLYDKDPVKNSDAKLLENVEQIDGNIRQLAGKSSSATGVGGMKAKLMAVEKASAYGVPTMIVSGKREGAILEALQNGEGGTFFHPNKERTTQRKHWIAHVLKPKGSLKLDDGAVDAIRNGGKSLLPSGILAVDGLFDTGEAVRVVDISGKELARGLVNYNSAELDKIKGLQSGKIGLLLGYKSYDEVIHRNHLVLLNKEQD